MSMTKEQAIKLLGSSGQDAANALVITRQAINQWPDQLKTSQSDRVIGAAVRLGITIPDSYTTNHLKHS